VRVRTAKVCDPWARPSNVTPGVTIANAAPSRLPSKLPSGSNGAKENVAEVERVGASGTDSKMVSAAGIETIHCAVAGVASVFPA
jgi:hypothetical protein